jgi:hypothetical protein
VIASIARIRRCRGARLAQVLEHHRAAPERADRVRDPCPMMSNAEPWIGSNIDG